MNVFYVKNILTRESRTQRTMLIFAFFLFSLTPKLFATASSGLEIKKGLIREIYSETLDDWKKNTTSQIIEVACDGIPNPGVATINPNSGPSGTVATLAASGYTQGEGISIEWQFKVGDSWWHDAPVPSFTLPFSGAPGDQFVFRFAVTCAISGETAYSNEVAFTIISESNCIPNYIHGCEGNSFISNFHLDGDNGTFLDRTDGICDTSYHDLTTESIDLTAGIDYSALISTPGVDQKVTIWLIDEQDNAILITPTTNVVPSGSSIIINSTPDVSPGTYIMRIMLNTSGIPYDHCTPGSGYGQTIDYTATVFKAESCSDVFAGIIMNDFAICTETPFSIGVSNPSENQAGLQGQWYQSPSGQNLWEPITGATRKAYYVSEGIIEPTDFYYSLTCSVDGTENISGTLSVSLVSNHDECYCVPNAVNPENFIRSFTATGNGVRNISNIETGFSQGGYGNYTHLIVSTYMGSDINFSADIDGSYKWLRIWVDWNNDGVFDIENELVYTSPNSSNHHANHFSVPTHLKSYGKYRMRIASTFGPTDPCSIDYTYGEFEDYTLEINNPLMAGVDCPIDFSGSFADGIGSVSGDIVAAADFIVPYDQSWNLHDLKLQMINPLRKAQISIYVDDNGSPGDILVPSFAAIPIGQRLIDVEKNGYEVEFDLSFRKIFLEGGANGARYWIAVSTETNHPSGNLWAYSDEINNQTNVFFAYDNGEDLEWIDPASNGFNVDVAFTICVSNEEINEGCLFAVDNIEAITRVAFADIDNNSPPTSSIPLEDFTEIEGNVFLGHTYHILLKGNTNGDNLNFFTVFVDWNQNGILDDSGEVYELGSLSNSNGNDYHKVTGMIEIPENALLGETTMRVIKSYGSSPIDPCGSYIFGQGEDYKIVIKAEDAGSIECPIHYEDDFESALENRIPDQILAADFPVEGGEVWRVNNVKIHTLEKLLDVEVSFYADDEGQPGSEISSPTVVLPISQNLIWSKPYPAAMEFYEIELDLSSLEINLDGGESGSMYWMAIRTTSSNPTGGHWSKSKNINNGTFFQASLDDYQTWEDTQLFDGSMTICVERVLDVNEESIFNFTYYPNPAVDILFVQPAFQLQSITIYNLLGQKIMGFNSSAVKTGEINIASLSKGVYIFEAKMLNGHIETFKIIKN